MSRSGVTRGKVFHKGTAIGPPHVHLKGAPQTKRDQLSGNSSESQYEDQGLVNRARLSK